MSVVLGDPKPGRRIRDSEVLRSLHFRWRECVLCDVLGLERTDRLSLHHIHRHPRDDVEANLAMVCGSGTTGHHGLIEAYDRETLREFVRYLRIHRADTLGYLTGKLGSSIAADEWLRRLGAGKNR